MKVKVERDWVRDAYKVWFYLAVETGSRVLRIDGDVREWVEVAPGAVLPEPSLILHEQEARLLAPELLGVLPPDTSMSNHLNDAVKVRDRLLTLVEKAAQS